MSPLVLIPYGLTAILGAYLALVDFLLVADAEARRKVEKDGTTRVLIILHLIFSVFLCVDLTIAGVRL